ncbi:MAG: hypothetical protein HY594_04425 [Candidatus Omnitrophica bacterium]|nr:hypothetical protein [Candidatus Omnitrophota bacterium]
MRSISLPSAGLDLAMTLGSGQVFRWKSRGAKRFCGVLGRSVFFLQQNLLLLHAQADLPADELRLRVQYFLRSGEDWPGLWKSVDVDPRIHAALSATRGLRILKQDPWESLASFIASSNNNIVRIEGMIDRLCRAFGAAIPHRGEIHFAFPRPESLSQLHPDALRRIGFGYRAPYLVEAARQVDSGEIPLQAIARMPYAQARETLLKVEGVGDKVVDCVLLFGFGHFEAFPVDVWVSRIMRKLYFRNRKVPDRKVRTFARRHFGPRCGLAQQALFHAARCELLEPNLPGVHGASMDG